MRYFAAPMHGPGHAGLHRMSRRHKPLICGHLGVWPPSVLFWLQVSISCRSGRGLCAQGTIRVSTALPRRFGFLW